MKAKRAYFALTSTLKHMNLTPRLHIKLFDALVKPIMLYACEVWGGFGIKRSNIPDTLLNKLMNNDNYTFEKLNVKLCKRSLRIPNRVSNIGSRAEVGRIPVMKSIIVAILKYNFRAEFLNDSDPLKEAFKSQNSKTKNAYNTFTYTGLCSKLLKELNVTEIGNQKTVNHANPKQFLNHIGAKIKHKCVDAFNTHFKSNMSNIRNSKDSKLTLYTILKKEYTYENYVDLGNTCNISSLVKFKLSTHNLPIERGRYKRPKIDRNRRVCSFCKRSIGNEFHVLMECQHEALLGIRNTHIEQIEKISPQIKQLPDIHKFIYILKGHDLSIVPATCQWIDKCNEIHKQIGL